MKTGAQQIATERKRQIDVENRSLHHDDGHTRQQLARAAASYLSAVIHPDEWAEENGQLPGPTDDWPWGKRWWKPSENPIRNLVKAGALIAAEIDRLQRCKGK